MKVYVILDERRIDLFDDSDTIDLKKVREEVKEYYGFEPEYRLDYDDNTIYLFPKGSEK